MVTALQPKLSLHAMIPPFTLPSVEGEPVSVWDFKGRANLVLAFLPGGDCAECEEFVHAVMDNSDAYREERTEVFGIVREAEAHFDELHPAFPLLYDETGEATEKYTDALPAVFVADRFGELYAQWIIGPDGLFPAQKRILDVIELINLECPE